MARYFIHSVSGGAGGFFSVNGQVLDADAGVDTGFSVDRLFVDPALTASARQQIQDQLVPAVNAQLVNSQIPLVFIASDIEWVC